MQPRCQSFHFLTLRASLHVFFLLCAALMAAASPASAGGFGHRDVLATLRAAAVFNHAGVIIAGRAAQGLGEGGDVITSALGADRGEPLEEQCRRALDDLYFEGIDALLLDDGPCCEPGSSALQSLFNGAEQLGIKVLSLSHPAHVEGGALLGPLFPAAALADAGASSRRSTAYMSERGEGHGVNTPGMSAVSRHADIQLFVPLTYNRQTARRLNFSPSTPLLFAVEHFIE